VRHVAAAKCAVIVLRHAARFTATAPVCAGEQLDSPPALTGKQPSFMQRVEAAAFGE
jgi:hypothetical protein